MNRILPIGAVSSHFSDVLAGMVPGEELIVTEHGEAKAVITRTERTSWPSVAGTAKDRSFWMAPDFDAPLEDFAEYME